MPSFVSMCLGFFLVILAVYAPVGIFEFVNFDDTVYVTDNLRVRSGLNWENLLWSLQSLDAGFWQPLTWLSLMLDYELYGLNAGGYHVTNVLIHIAATLVLFLALLRITGATWRSGFAAALFALHPLHVEAVAWVAERKDVLCGFFWMLTLYAYARYAERPGIVRYALVLAGFVGGLMSKAMIVTLPLVLLLLDYWPLGRWNGTSGETGKTYPAVSKARLIWEKVPFFAMAAVVTMLTFYTEERTGALKGFDVIPLDARISNALISYVLYLKKTIWPMNLAVYYPHPGRVIFWSALLSGAFLLGTTTVLFRFRRAVPYALVGWLWFLGTLLPVIGLVQIGGHAMADRYTYIPLIGIFMLLAWTVPRVIPECPWKKTFLIGFAVFVIVLLMFSTSKQIRHWTNSVSLFEHSIAVADTSYINHYNLGLALQDQRRYLEAEIQFRKAATLYPSNPSVHNNLGVVLALQNKDDEAVTAYREALRLKPDNARAMNNLAMILYRRGENAETLQLLRQAIRQQPNFANAHHYLGLTLQRMGNSDEAKEEFRKAWEINPAYRDRKDVLKTVDY